MPNIEEPKWLYFSSVSESAFPFHNIVADYLDSHPDIKLAFQPGKNEIKWVRKLARLHKPRNIFLQCGKAEIILGKETKNVLELSKGIAALGPKMVSISDGPNGACLYLNNELWSLSIYPDIAPPVERTGAGDAFSSTFTAALALGKSPLEAFAWGPINSMSVVQEIGAQKGLLTREKIEEYLKNAPENYKARKI